MTGSLSGPPAVSDAFELVFGRSTGPPVLRNLSRERRRSASLEDVEREFIRALAFALPSVSDRLTDPGRGRLARPFLESSLSNIFLSNPHAAGIAACIVYLGRVEDRYGGKRLMDLLVPFYLTFTSIASTKIHSSYRELLKADSPLEQSDRFGTLSDNLHDCLDIAERSAVCAGLQHLLDAVFIARERTIEESPLSVDLRIPVTCAWELALDAVSAEGGGVLAEARLEDDQKLLCTLTNHSINQLATDLIDAAKVIGRGVGSLSLRGPRLPKGSPKGLVECESIWENHAGAPLSRLYGLDWRLPEYTSRPDVRIVVLQGGNITISVHGDSLFDHLLGTWRYVDLFHKTKHIRSILTGESISAVSRYDAPLYRMIRLAYHLAYHNHGASVELNLKQKGEGQGNLSKLRRRWNVEIDREEGLSISPLTAGADALSPQAFPSGFGRLAYVLSIQDGLSTWRLAEDGVTLSLTDYGTIVDIEKQRIDRHRRRRAGKGEVEFDPLGGARHYSAFQRALDGGRNRVVLCVSQDGPIDAYVDGQSLRVR